MAEARLQLAAEALDAKRGSVGQLEVSLDDVEEEALASAQEEIKGCQASLAKCEEELRRVQGKKMELQKEVDRLTELAERALLDASKAEEDVSNIMVLAEQAVALEMEAAKRANDAELVGACHLEGATATDGPVDPALHRTMTCKEGEWCMYETHWGNLPIHDNSDELVGVTVNHANQLKYKVIHEQGP
jgi:hypothetical protein